MSKSLANHPIIIWIGAILTVGSIVGGAIHFYLFVERQEQKMEAINNTLKLKTEAIHTLIDLKTEIIKSAFLEAAKKKELSDAGWEKTDNEAYARTEKFLVKIREDQTNIRTELSSQTQQMMEINSLGKTENIRMEARFEEMEEEFAKILSEILHTKSDLSYRLGLYQGVVNREICKMK